MHVKEADPSVEALAVSAMNVQRQYADLVAMESSLFKRDNKGTTVGFDPKLVPGMQRVISLGKDWNGPVEPLIAEIAGLSNYTLRPIGKKPAGDVLVSVDTNYRRIIDILSDAGAQAGSRAVIRVLAKDRVIEVEYVKF